jgi:hypothetical protein
MASLEMAIEYKNRNVTSDMVATIYGKVIRRRPQVSEILIICRSADAGAYKAARDLSRNGGKLITLAPNP